MAERVEIAPDMTAGDLHDRLSALGGDLMVRALAALSRGGLVETPQSEEGVTYAKKIEKAEARIDWSKTATEVHNQISRALAIPRRVVRDGDRRENRTGENSEVVAWCGFSRAGYGFGPFAGGGLR